MNNYIKEALRFFILITLASVCFVIYKYIQTNNVISSYYHSYEQVYERELEQLKIDISNLDTDINNSNPEKIENQIEECKKDLLEINKYKQLAKSFDKYSYIDKIRINSLRKFRRIKIKPEECVQDAYYTYLNYLKTKKTETSLINKKENIKILPATSIIDTVKRYDYTIKYINLLKTEYAYDPEYFHDLNDLMDYCKLKIVNLLKGDNAEFIDKKRELANLENKLKKFYELKEKLKQKEENLENLKDVPINKYISSHFGQEAISLIQQLEQKRFKIKISLIINIFLLIILLVLFIKNIRKTDNK